MKAKFLLFLLASAAFVGCYYDNEEELYNCTVDTSAVRYSTTISSIFTSYGCTGCHGSAAPAGGVSLIAHAGVKAAADNGRLYGSINHEPGFSAMPQGGGKMPACDIKRVKAWIDAGAPNN